MIINTDILNFSKTYLPLNPKNKPTGIVMEINVINDCFNPNGPLRHLPLQGNKL